MNFIHGPSSALRGALWLVRSGGLRGKVRELEAHLFEAQEADRRLAEAYNRIIGQMVDTLDKRADRLGNRLDRHAIEARDHSHGLAARLDQLITRLDQLITRFEMTSAILRSRAKVRGHTMLLDPTDSIVSSMLLRDGYFELLETELVEREIRRGNIVLDVGANIGYYTLLFARLVGDEGRVYAFEPDPHNFALLKKNVRINGYRTVVLVNKAVSERTGPLKLYLCPDNKGDHRIYESEDARTSIAIEATTADDYFRDDPVRVNFIKMDIQGSEAGALRGMAATLERSRSVKMVAEFWPAGLRRSGAAAEDYLRHIEGLGFEIFEIDELRDLVAPRTIAELLRDYPP